MKKKKFVKPLLLLFITVLLCITLAACGTQNSPSASSAPAANTDEKETTETGSESKDTEDPETGAENTGTGDPEGGSEDNSLESGGRAAVEGFPTQVTENPLAETLASVPEGYLSTADQQGSLTTIEYQSYDRAGDGTELTKEAVVYLPYGYDADDSSVSYNIMYLMHGWTGRNDIFFRYDDSSTLQNVLDHMIENGDIEPLILVTPTFDRNNASTTLEDSVSEIKVFHEELTGELIPAVESEFHTFAETTDEDGLKASRDHRAFAGFSLGG